MSGAFCATEFSGAYEAAKARGLAAFDDISSGDTIFVGSSCADPRTLIEELVRRGDEALITGTTAFHMFGGSKNDLVRFATSNNTVIAFTATPVLEDATKRGYATFSPWTVYQAADLISAGDLRITVALVQTAPPDARGYLSFGVSADFAEAACRQANIVIAEVNDQMPRTIGSLGIHCSELSGVVEVSRPLAEIRHPEVTSVAREVAANVLPYVPDGATIEIGIGRIMSGIMEALHVRNDLGLHTGLLVDGMIDLIEAGVITNRMKRADQGLSIANQARGSKRLYDFIDGNYLVKLRAAHYTHSPEVLAATPNFRAINSALQVDLAGRINSEFAGDRRVSSTGGLGDFARAARYSHGARSIIALSSTFDSGRQSRIVPTLAGSTKVTLPADLADLVATEYGVADLRGKTLPQRAHALIEIAAPAHRPGLYGTLKAGGG